MKKKKKTHKHVFKKQLRDRNVDGVGISLVRTRKEPVVIFVFSTQPLVGETFTPDSHTK